MILEREKNLNTRHVVPNCFRTLVPKSLLIIVLFPGDARPSQILTVTQNIFEA